jgi:hypothetical protein
VSSKKEVPTAGFLVLGHHQWVFQSAHRSHNRDRSSGGLLPSFFPDVFDQKKGEEGSGWEWA